MDMMPMFFLPSSDDPMEGAVILFFILIFVIAWLCYTAYNKWFAPKPKTFEQLVAAENKTAQDPKNTPIPT